MSAHGASGAIFSKIRAMYGQRLTPADCDAMLARDSVAAVAAFLKGRPSYADELSSADTASIDALGLEGLVRRARYAKLGRLCRFGVTVGERIADCVILEAQTEFLTAALTRIASGSASVAEGSVGSELIDSYLGFDPERVAVAKSVREISSEVRDGALRRVLGSCPDGGGPKEIMKTVGELRAARIAGVAGIIAETAGDEADELLGILRGTVDLENVVAAYRLKKHFGADRDAVLAALVPGGGLDGAALLAIADAPDAEGVLAAARSDRRAAKLLRTLDDCYVIDDAPLRYGYFAGVKMIRYSSSPAAAMISFVRVTAVECSNVTKIIEGKRYGLDAREIRKMLILDERR